jgi:hypothetical protein
MVYEVPNSSCNEILAGSISLYSTFNVYPGVEELARAAETTTSTTTVSTTTATTTTTTTTTTTETTTTTKEPTLLERAGEIVNQGMWAGTVTELILHI